MAAADTGPDAAGGDRRVEWCFDFISPYAYLQLARLGELPGPAPRLRPVLFAGLLGHWGQLGPAEIPPKRTFTYRYVVWRGRVQGTPLRCPPAHPFNPLGPLRLAIACGGSRDVVGTIFDFIWRDGRDPVEEWPALCAALDLEPGEASARIAAPEVKDRLRGNTEAAAAAGVFGVPTLLIDGEPFWGLDATDLAAAFLRDPTLLDDPEMRRVAHLPAAVERRRGAPGPTAP